MRVLPFVAARHLLLRFFVAFSAGQRIVRLGFFCLFFRTFFGGFGRSFAFGCNCFSALSGWSCTFFGCLFGGCFGLFCFYFGFNRRSEERRVGKECRSRWS